MPYICTDQNRYIGEHACNHAHFGDMSIIRACCVADAKQHKETAQRVAMTKYHPSAQMFYAAWGSLTTAEREIVGYLELPVA